MDKIFVDTNIFIRFFTHDDKGQHEKVVSLFRKAIDGEIYLVTGPPVLFEIAWTLQAAYKLTKSKTLEALRAITSMPNLSITDSGIVESALTIAEHLGIEFADAYIIALANVEKCDAIATFNHKHFKKATLPLFPL